MRYPIRRKLKPRLRDLLADLFLIRRLPPWSANTTKRLVRAPKFYVRDSGLLHALLGLPPNMAAMLSHPVVGASWEGHVIEELQAVLPVGATGYFYRTQAGEHRPGLKSTI